MDECWSDDLAPAGVEVRSVEQLTGGFANTAWRVTLADGKAVVVKSSRNAPGRS